MNTNQISLSSLDHEKVFETLALFTEFLKTYSPSGADFSSSQLASSGPQNPEAGGRSLYSQAIHEMHEKDGDHISVDFLHITDFSLSLSSAIETHFLQLEPGLREVLRAVAHELLAEEEHGLHRRLGLVFENVAPTMGVRQALAPQVGQLVAIQGVVTRTSDVRPLLEIGVFKCKVCGTESAKIPQDFRFNQPPACARKENPATGVGACLNKDAFDVVLKKSTFVDWQRVLLQENSAEVPAGSLPRSLEVFLSQEHVEKIKPGDAVELAGSLIAVPDVAALYRNKEIVKGAAPRQALGEQGKTGVRVLGPRRLQHKLGFMAFGARVLGLRDSLAAPEQPLFGRDRFATDRVVAAFAREIKGQSALKTGLLLMLLSGNEKKTFEGIHLRGNINVLLVGDPSTAKSRFLRAASRLSARAVYTSGKSSSAAGLTASAMRDPDTGDFVVQAGALMLADGGVCCIDEFEKMDARDRSAIHEAMEQQTITLTKAGIHATMSVKASVLAACNPVGGRYDSGKPLSKNIDVSGPILSRFDLVFVLVDETDEARDREIARHIIARRRAQASGADDVLSEEELRQFLDFARTKRPVLSRGAQAEAVRQYRSMREEDSVTRWGARTTVRQLEALIRLSEAAAKLELLDEVGPAQVHLAAQLVRQSTVAARKREVVLSGEVEQRADDAGDRVSVAYEEYTRICSSIVLHLQEEKAEKTAKEIVRWYVKELDERGLLDKAGEALRQIKIATMVVQRMVHTDKLLIEEGAGLRLNPLVEAEYLGLEIKQARKHASSKGTSPEKKEEVMEKSAYDFDDI